MSTWSTGTESELPYEGLLSGGLTFLVNEDLQWDVGALYGLTRAADDLSVFAGVTVRY